MIKKIITMLFLTIILSNAALALGEKSQGYSISPGNAIIINDYDCQKVINTGSKSYFIPTKTEQEWINFKQENFSNPDISLHYLEKESSGCNDNDIYYFDTCGIRKEKRTECYESYCDTAGDKDYYCSGGDVWVRFDKRNRGCSSGSCYDYWTYNNCGHKKEKDCLSNNCQGGLCGPHLTSIYVTASPSSWYYDWDTHTGSGTSVTVSIEGDIDSCTHTWDSLANYYSTPSDCPGTRTRSMGGGGTYQSGSVEVNKNGITKSYIGYTNCRICSCTRVCKWGGLGVTNPVVPGCPYEDSRCGGNTGWVRYGSGSVKCECMGSLSDGKELRVTDTRSDQCSHATCEPFGSEYRQYYCNYDSTYKYYTKDYIGTFDCVRQTNSNHCESFDYVNCAGSAIGSCSGYCSRVYVENNVDGHGSYTGTCRGSWWANEATWTSSGCV